MLVLALTLAAEAPAAARMYLGFHDDVTFRWSPSRQANLDDARAAHVSVVRTLAQWAEIATRRPANARNPFDPAYNFGDLDELTQNTSARGIQLLIVIWGTPGWANGSRGTNHAPAKLSDLRDFARALAARYSGRYPGLPRVRMFSVWNEPNLNQFLAPQFDGRGRSVAPALYAKLYRAARAGLKAGNSAAQVAIGETSPRGKDRPGSKVQSSHSPVRFAQLLAAADRRIPFDAWGHHPYASGMRAKPLGRAQWPQVPLANLARFERLLDRLFRRRVTIWATEIGYETRPEERLGISYAMQARYLAESLNALRSDARVKVGIWFTFRDNLASNLWTSGVYKQSGAPKPSLARFTAIARRIEIPGP